MDISTMILKVENFHHRGGNIGPPIEVEFSTIFVYSVFVVRVLLYGLAVPIIVPLAMLSSFLLSVRPSQLHLVLLGNASAVSHNFSFDIFCLTIIVACLL